MAIQMLEKESGSGSNTLNLYSDGGTGTDTVFTTSVDNLLSGQSTEADTFDNLPAISAMAEENNYDTLPPRYCVN